MRDDKLSELLADDLFNGRVVVDSQANWHHTQREIFRRRDLAKDTVAPLVRELQKESPRRLQNRHEHNSVRLRVRQQVRHKTGGNQPVKGALPIRFLTVFGVRQDTRRRCVFKNLRPVFENRLVIFRRQLFRNFFRLNLGGQVKELVDKIFNVEVGVD